MKKANVLVVGSGGREHALVWKLQQSPHVNTVFCAPGNGGTPNSAPMEVLDFENLADFALRRDCFTVVGPEEPLAKGIVDQFQKKGLEIYGPSSSAALAESSKIWAKRFMKEYSIPTASFEVFDDAEKAMDSIENWDQHVVVKADGLAAGKGVSVCNNHKEARNAISDIMIERKFGEAGRKIVVEECLLGEEASYMAIVDTEKRCSVPLASSQDHKPIYDGDKGPNTGGMGAYSPAPVISSELEEMIQKEILRNFVDGMRSEGVLFKGTVFLGLMISNGQVNVLEFNVRFGDPELSAVIARLDNDLFPFLQACVRGRLDEMEGPSWSEKAAVCVIMASKGYPGKYEKGKIIRGLDEVTRMRDVLVFHAGTKKTEHGTLTNGGRVLGVTGLGHGIKGAIGMAYGAVNKINWEGEYHRTDIGAKALRYVQAS